MEVSMHNHAGMIFHKHKPFSKNPKLTISCTQLAMQSEKKPNFYKLLSLNSQNVGFDEIKKAYKTKALQIHPDVCTLLSNEESTKRFVELRRAYETLSDPNSRRVYDYELGWEGSFGIDFECVETRRLDNFPREVWERQLNGLKIKCGERMKTRR